MTRLASRLTPSSLKNVSSAISNRALSDNRLYTNADFSNEEVFMDNVYAELGYQNRILMKILMMPFIQSHHCIQILSLGIPVLKNFSRGIPIVTFLILVKRFFYSSCYNQT